MRTYAHLGMMLVAACLAAACVGCGSGKTTDERRAGQEKTTGQEGKGKAAGKAGKTKGKVEEPPPKPTIPEVALTDELRATCLVQVGDTMPEAELPDLQGNPQATTALYGEKLTVVCFWTAGNTPAVQLMVADMLEFLEKDIAEPYAEKGVRVIGISVGDKPETAAQLLSQVGAKFPDLFDSQGTFFAKVATEKLPRVYLLDAQGKVLWFDVPYSSSTQRLLKQSIKGALGGI